MTIELAPAAGEAAEKPTRLALAVTWIREVADGLEPCAFSAFILLVVTVALTKVPEGADVLRALAEEPGLLPRVGFFVALVFWAYQSWYVPRLLGLLAVPTREEARADSDSRRAQRVAFKLGPRVMGVAPFVGMAWALSQASYANAAGAFAWLAFITLALGVAFGGLIWRRRAIAAWLRRFPLLAGSPLLALEDEPEMGIHARLSHLPPFTLRLIAVTAAASLIIVAAFTVAPVWVGRRATVSSVLLFSAGMWIINGTALTYLGKRLKVPIHRVLIGWAIVISPINDDHVIPARAMLASPRPTVAEDFETWSKAAAAARAPGESDVVFLVTAEGGGIRAAYWTAAVLGKLAAKNPAFVRHTYAISSASGGTLGAAIFAELAAHGGHYERADEILSTDFLSPVIGKMLFPDMVQRLLPFPFPWFDRATALEEGWATAWQESTGGDELRHPFAELWKDPARAQPRLFFNTTHVETGKRAVIAYPLVRGADGKISPEVTDLRERHVPSPSMAAAVHLTARFPYVSPAATVPGFGHLADGGYFDNSGAATMEEVLAQISLNHAGRPVVVLVIRFADDTPVTPARWATEATAPPLTMLATQDARESLALAALKQRAADAAKIGYAKPTYVDLALRRAEIPVPLPLGWMLSAKSAAAMRDQVDHPREQLAASFAAVTRALEAP